ncbi:uncharacterized protein LOC130992869 [Salvia miltiorrhiza]|uniref:uncharacterized protein LOC130992869 n=1 Tax=Salvia miltiorrhiza TaxID=226208 RepID=UPI0025ACDBE4|nr:uncharacterized protein LOC130992869 [Salvia miltiorrhiza]
MGINPSPMFECQKRWLELLLGLRADPIKYCTCKIQDYKAPHCEQDEDVNFDDVDAECIQQQSDIHNSIVMKLVKKVAHRGSTAPDSIAKRFDQKSYTYVSM